METLSIVLIIVSIILVIALVAVFIYNINLETSMIDPKNCPLSSGDFGLTPRKTGTTLEICTSGVTTNTSAPLNTTSSSCTFVNVPDLLTATNLCNAYKECSSFSYSANTNTMMILDPNKPLIDNDDTDVYNRQVPTIFV